MNLKKIKEDQLSFNIVLYHRYDEALQSNPKIKIDEDSSFQNLKIDQDFLLKIPITTNLKNKLKLESFINCPNKWVSLESIEFEDKTYKAYFKYDGKIEIENQHIILNLGPFKDEEIKT